MKRLCYILVRSRGNASMMFILLVTIMSCSKPTVTVRDRGEQFEHDTTITFGEFRGEPGPVSRRYTFDIRGSVTMEDGFPGLPESLSRITVSVSPDTVRLIVRHAIDAGIYSTPDSVFSEPEEGVLDGPSHYHYELNAGRRSKLVDTDGSHYDDLTGKLITLSNVVDYIVWSRLPEEKRWRWYGPAYRFEDIK